MHCGVVAMDVHPDGEAVMGMYMGLDNAHCTYILQPEAGVEVIKERCVVLAGPVARDPVCWGCGLCDANLDGVVNAETNV